ncbi:outer membrane assembly protein AsmA [Mangrovibacter phragmitis]|uniref:outer membrane assembly protein AsmA n=1 Tax=Mangrovibacter phragmitis TaxID=1691903 RepID=UPI00336A6726
MRRFLTTLMILLVVIVAGLSALVLLVNPNDFRAYMVHQVEERSGYQLSLNGPLRWHVWPQLSILSGRISLKAPGASAPVVTADNMRLDVGLLPLLSHQLDVRQIMLKGAVIQVTPDTAARAPQGAPVAPQGQPESADSSQNWVLSLAKLKLADSLLVFQPQDKNSSPVTVRDLQLDMSVDKALRTASVSLSSRINRDQRDLSVSLESTVDVQNLPHSFSASITQLNYQLSGADLPAKGVSGEGSLHLGWQSFPEQVAVSALKLTANSSQVDGGLTLKMGKKPDIRTQLHFARLNLDELIGAPDTGDAPAAQQNSNTAGQAVLPRPVIAGDVVDGPFTSLWSFDANFRLSADSVLWRGLDFTDVAAEMENQHGVLAVNQLTGKLGQGTLSLPGTVDVRKNVANLTFNPVINNVEIGPILSAFDYPIALEGAISLHGRFSGHQLDAEAFRRNWQGEGSLSMTHSRLLGMNFQRLVTEAFARSDSRIQSSDSVNSDDTTLADFRADLVLDSGTLDLSNIQGSSAVMSITGDSSMDLVKEASDANFMIRITGGWKGDSKLTQTLSQTAIPLRIYGPWQSMNYSLDVNQVLRNQLQNEARDRLKAWAERNKESSKTQELKKLLNK